MTLQREVHTPRTFSLAQGPFAGLLQRLHLARKDGTPRALPLVILAWVPLCLGALSRVAFGERPQPILYDLSVHVRLLVGIPLLVLAGQVLDVRCRSSVEQLYEGELAETSALDPIIGRAERLRDSRVAMVVTVAIAIAAGQLVLWGATGSTGVVAGVAHAGQLSFARIWYACIALPLMQFLMLRWLWLWLIWSYIVIDLSRLPLATNAMHPDHAGGLSVVASPISAFTLFTFGVSSVIAGAWGTKILHGNATMQTFIPSFLAFVVVAAVISCGPQLAYIGQLYDARHRDGRRYHMFALGYVRDFHRKWLVGAAPEELGSQDIQALNDLGGAFATLDRTRLLPVGARLLGGVWLAALIPMVPIAFAAMPVTELVKHVGGAMLGGLAL